MNDKEKQIDLRKRYYVDTATISGDYIQITTDNTTAVINLKDEAFADIKEININGVKFQKLSEDSLVLTNKEFDELKGRAEEVFNEMTERMKAEVKIAEKMGGIKARKETAREIFKELKVKLKGYIGLNYLDELAKQYGVE